jgi:hypothetical protein
MADETNDALDELLDAADEARMDYQCARYLRTIAARAELKRLREENARLRLALGIDADTVLAPCGGTRCFEHEGKWIHSSKSYGTCSVLAEPAKEAHDADGR